MADAPLIYLAGAGETEWQPDNPVLYQSRNGETVQWLALGEALAACQGSNVSVVVSVSCARLTHVTLSRKQARHLQRVLPYLLEEQLLDNPDDLWFVSRKGSGDDYQVSAVRRELITNLKQWAGEAGAHLASLQVDADCLQAMLPLTADLGNGQQLLLIDREQGLVIDEDQQEAFAPLLGDSLDQARQVDLQALFTDLRHRHGQELLTGPYMPRQTRRESALLGPWRPVAYLAAAVFLVAVVAVWVQQWRYQQAADAALAQAKNRYEQLFPGDKATSALNRQFQGRLARLGGGADGGGAAFFPLLAPVAQVLKDMKMEPKRLQYDQRQNVLLVDVGAKDYAQLEALQNAIRKQGGNASIANYRNGAQGVSARIKVEQPG
ncbi:type II secretion system protein GspL [Alcanivorax jadensis]|uniref:type II secretion system protein GspL n=1 Tax=Alcanivorax jadensis TaxID=64988 RepID=UPI0005566935|nr:type II secretion system protein GspL [Alcanivorax jadensis]